MLRVQPLLSGMWSRCWGAFDATFERGAGTWAADAGGVVLPPSGWDDELTPFVDDEGEDE